MENIEEITNITPHPNTDFIVRVFTRGMIGSGTFASVKLFLINTEGEESESREINSSWWNYLSVNSIRDIELSGLGDIGRVSAIRLLRGRSTPWGDWYVDGLQVRDVRNNRVSVFPIHRWIYANRPVRFKEFDACLPQDDDDSEQRSKELVEQQEVYKSIIHQEGLLPQVEKLPWQEKFSLKYQLSIGTQKLKLKAHMLFHKFLNGSLSNADEVMKLYNAQLHLPIAHAFWKTDEAFGQQRLNHCNPTQIRLCEKIPDKFAVTEDMVSPLFEEMTLQAAINAKKLYYIDYCILKDLKCPDKREVCAPFALFFVNSKGNLVPIAIQLFQVPSETNPVFLPTDDPYVWLCAKLWFNNADASFHQSCTHLGFTHLIMEPICLATNWSLSRSHPIFRLLAPHFLYLLAINNRGLDLLTAKGGWVDKCMTIGTDGMFEIISRELKIWRMDVQGTLPNDLKERGVDDPEALPQYYYRDDALLIYNAIHKYVTEVVNGFYENADKVKSDNEVQEWARCLSDPHEKNGVGIPGVHGGGKLETIEEVVCLCTSIIFIGSVAHAASNFSQYDDYGYPANYPAFLYGSPIRDKKPRTSADVSKLLPREDICMDTLLITRLLSTRSTKSLGEFEVQFLFDPKSEAAAKEFRQELKSIGQQIELRNMKIGRPYNYLHPGEIPNSISI
ncbi:arachidonate 12-lipoxygenase, 12R-type-like [Apostichopus japonicus]|uniref:arachidonate 12-lipoxygenase, 12R-type-like n=1 Tax=Stichopus japonicus TaxID=307972 RepID=UPI003AB66ABC